MALRLLVLLAVALLAIPTASQASWSAYMNPIFMYADNPITGYFSLDGSSHGGFRVGPWEGYADQAATNYIADFYCIDIEHSMAGGTLKHWEVWATNDLELETLGIISAKGSLDGLGIAAAMYNGEAAKLANPTDDLTKKKRTALQISLWEAYYDYSAPGSYASDGGNFVVSDLSGDWDGDILAFAYGGSVGGMDVDGYLATYAQSFGVAGFWNDGQDLLGPVPEPGTLVLLGLGLAGAGFVLRKRQKA